MATLRTVLELALRGGTETQRQLEQVGKVGAEAFKKIDEGSKRVPASLRAVDAAASEVRGSVERLAAKAGPLGAALSSIAGPVGLLTAGAAGAAVALTGMATKAIAAADDLGDAAQAIGVNVEALQAFRLAAKDVGVGQDQLDAALRKFVKTVGEAQLGTGSLVSTLGKMNPELLQSVQAAGSVEQKLGEVLDAVNALPDPFQKAALATAAFGREGVQIAQIAPIFRDVAAQARASGAILGGDLVAGADAAQRAMDQLSASLKGNVQRALLELSPVILTVADQFNRLLKATITPDVKFLDKQAIKDELKAAAKDPGAISAERLDQLRHSLQAIRLEERARNQGLAIARETGKAVVEVTQQQTAAVTKLGTATRSTSRAETDRQRALAELSSITEDNVVAELDAIGKIERARDQQYEHVTALAKAGSLTEQEAAAYYLEIWKQSTREVEQARADAVSPEVVSDSLERDAQVFDRYGDIYASSLRDPIAEAFEDITDVAFDSLEAFANGAHVTFDDIAADLKSSIIHALIEIAKQQLLLSIGANVTGGGGGGALGGGGGGGLGGLFNTGQQLLSFGNTFKSGMDLFGSYFGAGTEAFGTAATTFGAAVDAFGVSAGTFDAAMFGIENAGTLAINGAAGVAPGTGPLAIDAAGNVVSGTTTGGSAAGGLGGAAATGAILFAVVAALESLQAGLGAIKSRDGIFNYEQMTKAVGEGFSPWVKALGNVVAYVGTGHSGGDLQKSTLDVLGGDASAHDYVKTIMYAILNPMLFNLSFWMKDLSTGGTALRKNFEEFIENDGIGTGFFGRDSGTFKRGIGQTGLSANDVSGSNILSFRRKSIGQGARGIQSANPGMDFVDAQKEFIRLQKESIGLTDEQLKQVTGLAAAFRAAIGGQAGEEPTRTFGVIADLLGSINAEGADAAETMDIVANAIVALGRPAQVLDTLNEFFLSKDNDIAVETYREAVQGLASALFQELPQGVDAAAIALRELEKAGDGKVKFEDITRQIAAAVAEAEALLPGIQQAFIGGINDAEFDLTKLGDAIFDAAEGALKEATAQLTFDTFVKDAFTGDIFRPVQDAFTEVQRQLAAGEITDAEATQILAEATTIARDNLETLRPLLDAAAQAGRDLAAIFDDAAAAAEDMSDVLTPAKALSQRTFLSGIDRQTLGILDPGLAAQFDQEVQARQRLFDARALGLEDLTKIEYLNELERNAIVEQSAEERTRIEAQAAEQIQRIIEQNTEAAKRALESVGDFVKQLTGSPSSPLPPEQALGNAQAEFNRLAAAARAGDLSAIEALPEAGQNLLELARSLFGSTDQFFTLFGPTLDTLKEIAGLDPTSVDLSADARAQIDAINADKAEQLATLNKHHDEAMKLWQAMLDALLLGPDGKETVGNAPGQGSPGDQVSVPIVGGTAGQFGLDEQESISLQKVLGKAKVGGDIQNDILKMIEAGSFSAGTYGPLLAQLFEGATSQHGQLAVLNALNEKIKNPKKVQPVLGFATGGSFTVNGPGAGDIYPLPVRVSARETVTVTTHGMDQKLGEVVAELRRQTAENAAMRREISELRAQVSGGFGLYQQAQLRERAARR